MNIFYRLTCVVTHYKGYEVVFYRTINGSWLLLEKLYHPPQVYPETTVVLPLGGLYVAQPSDEWTRNVFFPVNNKTDYCYYCTGDNRIKKNVLYCICFWVSLLPHYWNNTVPSATASNFQKLMKWFEFMTILKWKLF